MKKSSTVFKISEEINFSLTLSVSRFFFKLLFCMLSMNQNLTIYYFNKFNRTSLPYGQHWFIADTIAQVAAIVLHKSQKVRRTVHLFDFYLLVLHCGITLWWRWNGERGRGLKEPLNKWTKLIQRIFNRFSQMLQNHRGYIYHLLQFCIITI